jgi:hypothetical protein
MHNLYSLKFKVSFIRASLVREFIVIEVFRCVRGRTVGFQGPRGG